MSCIQDKVPNSKRGFHKIYLDLVTPPSALVATPEKGSASIESEREKQARASQQRAHWLQSRPVGTGFRFHVWKELTSV